MPAGENEDERAVAPELRRHEHLREPSGALAAELFVEHRWLSEVREVLNERRQVVFYGPPGTGKTYVARKLAADLVGSEQVKLVQFHPAYTHEDFFEGYRPAQGAAEGTIGFELKAGPLRQLAGRHRAPAQQALRWFVRTLARSPATDLRTSPPAFGAPFLWIVPTDQPLSARAAPLESARRSAG